MQMYPMIFHQEPGANLLNACEAFVREPRPMINSAIMTGIASTNTQMM